MNTCNCTHADHDHKLMQQVLWPHDTEPPIQYRGACYKCHCSLFVDSRQMNIETGTIEIA